MRLWKLIGGFALALGLSTPAFAAPDLSVSVQRPTLTLGSGRISLGHRGVSIGTRIGKVGVHVGSRRGSGYVTRRCEPPRRVYVKGHYQTVERKVWVPERKERVWCDAVYETRYDSCGRAVRVLVRPARYEWVTTPGYYELKTVRVWVPGRWEYRS